MPDIADPLTLALDTTTRAGSVAITRGGQNLAVVVGDPNRTHGERLPDEIAVVLGRAGVRLSDVVLFAVAAGPGSFTGLRVGIAAIQGLALATSRNVVPVPTLDALAACEEASTHGGGPVAVWMDAQRGQVFAALYDGMRQLAPAVALTPPAVIALWGAGAPAEERPPALFVGDGAVRYGNVIAAAWPAARVVAPPPLAPVIGRLAAERAAQAVAPHAIVPVYVRPPDAELARDRSRNGTARAEGS